MPNCGPGAHPIRNSASYINKTEPTLCEFFSFFAGCPLVQVTSSLQPDRPNLVFIYQVDLGFNYGLDLLPDPPYDNR